MTVKMINLLEQTSIWRGQDGRVFYVGELSDEHLGNIIAYLNRCAGELLEERRDMDEFDLPPQSLEQVQYIASVDALSWLHDRPLYQRLLSEQRKRASVDGEVVDRRELTE